MINFDSLSPELIQALRDTGWHPRRRTDITQWVDTLQNEGYYPNPRAEEILVNLGGLAIQPANRFGPNFRNDEAFNFDPISAGSGLRSLALEIEVELGGKYFPVGEWLSYSSVFVETGGTVVAAGLGWIWKLGSTFEDALELTICANQPLTCLYSDPGLDPWPA